MGDLLDFINKHGQSFLLICQVLIVLAVLYLRGKFAPKELEQAVTTGAEQTTKKFFAIENRLALLEDGRKDIPTSKDLHQLELKITNLAGDMKRIEESIDGTEGILQRLERQVDRIEDFLKRTP